MLKLVKHIALLLFVIIIADRVIGTVLEHMFYKQKHGDDFITLYMLDSTRADILILGSSRASHHYVSDSIEKYTGLKTFNGGRDNMGIHYTEATVKELLKRHRPRYIIFDIIPYNFIKGNQNSETYFQIQSTVLLPFANRHPGLYTAIGAMKQEEVWKAKAIKTYAFNSLMGSIFQNAYTHLGHQQIKGYEPLDGHIDTANYHQQLFAFTPIQNGIDTAAFDVLKSCLDECHRSGVQAVICFSPFYFPYHHEPQLLTFFNTLCTKYHTLLLDHASDTLFTKHPELFYDELHLNNAGASFFSHRLAEKLSYTP
jgi:hypothetical protein